MSHLGDFDAAAIIYGKFSTYRPSTGATFTLGGSPVLSVYKDNSTTQSTTGVTLTADFDSVTGLNHFAIDTSADGTFYAVGSFFDIVITTGTVDSVSVTGSVVGSFTLRKTASIKPTVAGRTLDVSTTGEAGVDWANVGSPTTTLALTGTTIATTQKVDVETIKTQAVTAGAGVTFPATIASSTNITAGTITTVTNLTNAPTAGDFTATMKTSIGTAVSASAVASVTGNVGGNVTGSVGSVVGAVGSVTGNVGGNVVGTVASVVGAVGSVTGNVGGNVTGSVGSVAAGGIAAGSFAANAVDANALAADAVAEIQSGLATAATLATVKAVTDLLNLMIEVGPGSPTYYRYNAGALELAPTGGSAPSAAVIADAVWDEARAGHVAGGSFGEGVASVQGNVTGSVASVTADVGITQTGADKVWGTATRLLTAGTNIVLAKGVGITGFNDLSAADVRTAVGLGSANLDTQLGLLATASALTTVGGNVTSIKTVTDLLLTMIEVGTGSPTYYRFTVGAVELAPSGGGSPPTAAAIADAVWDEAIAGHLGAGSTGLALSNAGAAGNPWSTVIEGAYTAEDFLRFLGAVAVGKTDIVSLGGGAATVTIRDVTDASNIITATMAGSERASLVLAP